MRLAEPCALGRGAVKIAILTPGGVDRDGRTKVIPVLLSLIERLVRQGDEVHVFALRQEPEPGRWDLLGATVHNVGRRPLHLRLLRMLVAEHRLGAFDVIHALWAAEPGFCGAIAARLLRVPLVLSLPGGDVVSHPDFGFGAFSTWRGRLRVRLAVAGASAINTPSEWMTRLTAKAGISAETIALGVALDRWPVAAPRAREAGTPLRLLHVASLNRVKDQPTLLRAMALLKERGVAFELDVAGFDTLAGEVQRLAAQLGLGAEVRFLGFLPHDLLRARFDRADVFVLASIHEAGPASLLEAAVAGLAVVGTAVGHFVDFAPGAAVAVPVGDAVALADALEQIARNEPHRLRLAAAAQDRALRLDADFTCRAFLRSYREVTGRAVKSSEAEISSRV
jgi:glycosyltransferase involved in cell wall biosynthesis